MDRPSYSVCIRECCGRQYFLPWHIEEGRQQYSFKEFPSSTERERERESKKMGSSESEAVPFEDLLDHKKPIKNPLVPIGALLTAGVLTAGLISFRQGNSRLGQKLMGARVIAQGTTLALMLGTAYYYGDKFLG